MGRATTRFPMSRRVFPISYDIHGASAASGAEQPAMHLSNSIFGFLEEQVTSSMHQSNNLIERETEHEIEDDEDDGENPENIVDNSKFWETLHQNLHTTLFRTTALESNIRKITNQVLEEVKAVENVCSCLKPVSGGCRSCRMREICALLQKSGHNSAICKSKWKSSLDIPSGEHTFLDVIDNSNCKKGEVRVIIELDFRGTFEMKKGSDEYNRLVCKLPDVFVGKIERLVTAIKILSTAAKKCMKEKKMHLGPWRKQKYMEAKWLRVVERTTTTTLIKPLESDDYSSRPARTKASMLTMDLLENLTSLSHVPTFCTSVVEVL